MKNLHLVSILDRSGSMGSSANEVIGAYNAFIKEQSKIVKDAGVNAKVSLVLFDNMYEQVYLKTPIDDVPELTSSVYYTRGMTALYDAIGKTIASFEGKKNVLFFIETDGFENCSREYNDPSKLKELIEQKEADGWEFRFVGADLSAHTTANIAANIGIGADKTMRFTKSVDGYNDRNMNFADATVSYLSK